MKRSILSLIIFLIISLIIIRSSFSEDNIKIKLKSFEPGFILTVSQGSWNRTLFMIQNTFNESVIMYYKFEQQPSGVSITYYPNKFYNMGPNSEIAGNLNFSANQTAKNGIYFVKFWIETFSEIENKTIKSDKYTINLTVLNNPLIVNMTTTTPNQTTTSLLGTTTKNQSTTTVQPTQPDKKNVTSLKKEYLVIPIVLLLLFVLPPIMLRERTKDTVST